MKDDPIFKEENNHLAKTVAKVISGKRKLEKDLQVLGESNLEKLKEFREAGVDAYDPDFFMFLERLQEKNETFDVKYKYKRLKEFEQMMEEPYFSRIDVSNPKTDERKELYIGKFGYTEEAPVIIDWRAKIASIYYRYRYPQKNVKYETQEGIRELDLLLKRTFEIDNSRLIKYFNNDIQLDETEIIIDKIGERTGGVLEDIVETIQLSQLDIIESDPRQVCIVQGCVGSGKSTVAIHKLAHIFFNYPELIHPGRSILIAKNQILVGYLSTLFPKLGIFDINFKTIRELLVHIVFREELNVGISLDDHIDTSSINLKRIKNIQKKIDEIHAEVERDLIDLFSEDEDFDLFAGYKYSKTMSPYENLTEIINDLNEELIMQKERYKSNPNSVNSWFYKENLALLRRIITRLDKLKKKIKHKILQDLAKSEGINLQERLGYWETLLYLYLYSELIGIQKYPMFEYCVVDEGQDFSVLEYAFLSKLVLRGRFSIFGDLNQSLEQDGITSWEEITEVIKEARYASTFSLDTNYRSTKPIIEYANGILKPYTDKYLPKSINRIGPDPTELVTNYERMLDKFRGLIEKDARELDKSVGIICFEDQILESVEGILMEINIPTDKLIRLEQNTTVHYIPRGIYLMHMDNCKGLEFSKVYVLGLNKNKIDSFERARRAFVAVTRAMNELIVLGVDNASVKE